MLHLVPDAMSVISNGAGVMTNKKRMSAKRHIMGIMKDATGVLAEGPVLVRSPFKFNAECAYHLCIIMTAFDPLCGM